jgi:hypothetical protein
MYKYDIQNMFLLKKKSKINNIINIKSWQAFLSQHVVKNLQSMTEKKTIIYIF